jgi:hypothetical protein
MDPAMDTENKIELKAAHLIQKTAVCLQVPLKVHIEDV